MTAATIWFGWYLCLVSLNQCIPMKTLEACEKANFRNWQHFGMNEKADTKEPDKYMCINNETGERK